MDEKLYELLWQVETDPLSFIYREFKVFRLEEEAEKYGRRRETELNDGASFGERAQDGHYFEFCGANEVMDIDGFIVKMTRKNPEGGYQCDNLGS